MSKFYQKNIRLSTLEDQNFANQFMQNTKLIDFLQNHKIDEILYKLNIKIKDYIFEEKYDCLMFFHEESMMQIPFCRAILELNEINTNDIIPLKPGDKIQVPQYDKKMTISKITRQATFFIIDLEHPVFIANYQSKFKVFQKKTITEIIKAICQELNIKCEIKGISNERIEELVVMYNETYMNFLNRMCARACVHWRCSLEGIEVGPLSILAQKGDFDAKLDILRLIDLSQRIDKTGGRINAYNPENPSSDLQTKKESDFNYHEIFSENYIQQNEGKNLLEFINSAFETKFISFLSKKQLNLLDKIIIDEHEYFVTHIEHYAGSFTIEDKESYIISFYVEAKNTVNFRDFIQPVARTQKATTVLPENGSIKEEIFMDEKNRVMINFHFDENKSKICTPVIQSNSFNEHGTFFIPRTSTEVVIDFINGDPDKPIIIGCAYNKNNPNPFKTHQYGWNLKSLGNRERENILRMSVLDHQELIEMYGPKDIHVKAEGGDLTIELNDKDGKTGNTIWTTKHGNYTFTIKKGNKVIKIEDGNMDINVSDTLTIHAKDIKITADKSYQLTVGTNSTVQIGENLTQKISQNKTEQIGMNFSQEIEQNFTTKTSLNKTENVGANCTQIINAMYAQTVSGSATRTSVGPSTTMAPIISVIADAEMTLVGNGAVNILSDGLVGITSQGMINLASEGVVSIACEGAFAVEANAVSILGSAIMITGANLVITVGVFVITAGSGVLAGAYVTTGMFGIGFLFP